MQKILTELASTVGMGKAIEICRRWGGRGLQVPERVEDGDPLALAIGLESARALVLHYCGRRIDLPTERNAMRRIRDEAIRRDRASGMSQERIGAAYGITRQAVAHVLKQDRTPQAGGDSSGAGR